MRARAPSHKCKLSCSLFFLSFFPVVLRTRVRTIPHTHTYTRARTRPISLPPFLLSPHCSSLSSTTTLASTVGILTPPHSTFFLSSLATTTTTQLFQALGASVLPPPGTRSPPSTCWAKHGVTDKHSARARQRERKRKRETPVHVRSPPRPTLDYHDDKPATSRATRSLPARKKFYITRHKPPHTHIFLTFPPHLLTPYLRPLHLPARVRTYLTRRAIRCQLPR